MNRNDYYALLGVETNASKAAIRRAFQKLARKYHPDLNPGDNVAAIRYQRIYEAFEVLIDAEKRGRYDTEGARPQDEVEPQTANYGFEGFDFSLGGEKRPDIFPELFQMRSGSRRERERGEDIHHRLTLSFTESLSGLKTSFQVSRSITCSTCEGFREIPSAEPRLCDACEGRGRTTQVHGFMLFARPCAECRGTGKLSLEPCPDCRGAGRSLRTESVAVEMPPGVSDGEKMVISGMGHEGRGSGATGDLYVHVQVHRHPLFSRRGDNLFCTVPISFSEAGLGARIEVPTPDGQVTLRIPAGVQSGQKLRLAGRGASRRGGVRGDLFVTVKLVTPTVYDDRSRELLRELERLNPLGPRNPSASALEEVS